MDPCIYQDITRRSQQISQLKLLGLGIAEAKAYIQNNTSSTMEDNNYYLTDVESAKGVV